MSNALFEMYGKATESLWFPGLLQFDCPTPEDDLLELDKIYPLESALYFLGANKGISYIGISAERSNGGLFKRLRTHWRTPQKTFEFCYAFGLPPNELDQWETEAIHLFQPSENRSKRDYDLDVDDDIFGLTQFLEKKNYFNRYGDLNTFRIDTRFW